MNTELIYCDVPVTKYVPENSFTFRHSSSWLPNYILEWCAIDVIFILPTFSLATYIETSETCLFLGK